MFTQYYIAKNYDVLLFSIVMVVVTKEVKNRLLWKMMYARILSLWQLLEVGYSVPIVECRRLIVFTFHTVPVSDIALCTVWAALAIGGTILQVC